MVHVFVLMLYMGDKLISNDMMFYNINDCNYFASRLTKTYGNYKYSDLMPAERKRTAYCVPRLVDQAKHKIY